MNNVTPVNEEYIFEGSAIVSQTDLKGIITFSNRKFCNVSGYKVSELVGSNHNIIRHPDMPKSIFAKMWNTIESGESWNGLVKNLRKDGLYYWVYTEITPIFNKNNEITGYIASRKNAPRKDIEESDELYRKILKTKGN
ncbi:PAS domain-containing protein [Sulfurimonas sp.]|uniref:PAS domain-containing protein n=1 Tax=Sulfurimonas sp. TaxID=2022749 RepID=UPI002B45D177|nr:PAS domain-containing protein [Sulfurimonas sp.]